MDKRTLLAVAFAIAIMVIYSYFVQKAYPPQAQPMQQQQTVTSQPNQAQLPAAQAVPVATTQTITAKLSDAKLRKLSSDTVDYEISDIGASIKSINVKKYNELRQKDAEVIYDIDAPANAIFSLTRFFGKEDLVSAQYRYSAIENGAEYTLDLDNGIEIKKIYRLSNNKYGIELEIKITNSSGALKSGNYMMTGPSSIKVPSGADTRFVEAVVSSAGIRKSTRPQSVRKKPYIVSGDINWLALQSKFFCMVVRPYQPTVTSMTYSTVTEAGGNNDNSNVCMELQSDMVDIKPGSSVSNKFLLYSGPINAEIMSSYAAGIENSVSLGAFSGISKVLLSTLKFVYKVTHNYGVAIIILAFLIAIILYPLNLKSLTTMKKMQMLQPKIDKLRKELKDNPQKLNKELMEVYKKNKVNPFGGCLPMLLQMPIFIALYQAFSRAIELKNAGFLWIKDLSMPDSIFVIPTSAGTGFSINILPVLMAITMFFQQKMSASSNPHPDPADPMYQQQKMMGLLMPVLFGFIFYNMASGLVLYWFTSTLLMVLQQARITKSFHVESAVV